MKSSHMWPVSIILFLVFFCSPISMTNVGVQDEDVCTEALRDPVTFDPQLYWSLCSSLAGDALNFDLQIRWYRLAAEHGAPLAAYRLGHLLESGRILPRDLDEAANNFHAAVTSFFAAARKGDDQAAFYLGDAHRFGRGVTRDIEQARKWYQAAASLGNKLARATLSEMHQEEASRTNRSAAGVPFETVGKTKRFSEQAEVSSSRASLDPVRAARIRQRASEASAKAAWWSAVAETDIVESARWLENASAKGNQDATFALARFFGDQFPQKNLINDLFDPVRSDILRRSQFLHIIKEYPDLGGVGLNGPYLEFLRRNHRRAAMDLRLGNDADYLHLRYYESFLDREVADLEASLSKGVSIDRNELIARFEKRAQDYPTFQYALGLASYYGLAYPGGHYSPLADSTSPSLTELLESELAGVRSVANAEKRDFSDAAERFRKTAEIGSAHAMLALGFLYRDGLGVQRSRSLARRWWDKAFEQVCRTRRILGGSIERDIVVFFSQPILSGYPRDKALADEWRARAGKCVTE